jgi:hypothetical protein
MERLLFDLLDLCGIIGVEANVIKVKLEDIFLFIVENASNVSQAWISF